MRTISAGKDTVFFAATAAANGEDTITGFTAGTGADADVLNFKATGVKGTAQIVGSGTLSDSSGIGVITGVESIEKINFKTSASSAGDVVLSKKGSYIIITDVDGDDKAGNIYLVTAGTDNATSSDDITITLLGTVMREGDAGTYNTDNFVGYTP